MDDLIDTIMAAGRRYEPMDGWGVPVCFDAVELVVTDRFDDMGAAQAEADRLNREAMRAVLEPLVGAKCPTYHGLPLDELARSESYHPGDDA